MTKLHIQLEEGQKIWFISDLHFGHRNVIRFCNRPFEDEKDMGLKLIENWNEQVDENDIVFVLGDTFWFNDSRSIKKVFDKLNGKTIYVIPGNHDEFEHYHRVDTERIKLLSDVVVMWLQEFNSSKKYEIWMSHYPMMTWPHRENGSYQLFGHIHSKVDGRNGDFDQNLPLHWNQCDVGCDYWGYKPVGFDVLKEFFISKKKNLE